MMEHKMGCLRWFGLEEDLPPSPWVRHSRAKLGVGGRAWPQSNMYIILKIINFLQMLCKLSCSRAQAIVLSKSLGVVLDIHLLFPNAIQSFFFPVFYFLFFEACSNKPVTYVGSRHRFCHSAVNFVRVFIFLFLHS